MMLKFQFQGIPKKHEKFYEFRRKDGVHDDIHHEKVLSSGNSEDTGDISLIYPLSDPAIHNLASTIWPHVSLSLITPVPDSSLTTVITQDNKGQYLYPLHLSYHHGYLLGVGNENLLPRRQRPYSFEC